MTRWTVAELEEAKDEIKGLRRDLEDTRQLLAAEQRRTTRLRVELRAARTVRRVQGIAGNIGALLAGGSVPHLSTNTGLAVGGLVIGVVLLAVGWWPMNPDVPEENP
jgi:hypothetical protein